MGFLPELYSLIMYIHKNSKCLRGTRPARLCKHFHSFPTIHFPQILFLIKINEIKKSSAAADDLDDDCTSTNYTDLQADIT